MELCGFGYEIVVLGMIDSLSGLFVSDSGLLF